MGFSEGYLEVYKVVDSTRPQKPFKLLNFDHSQLLSMELSYIERETATVSENMLVIIYS